MSAPARTTTTARHRAEGKVSQAIIRWGLGVSEAFRIRFLSASSVDHCPVSFDHRDRRQAQAVPRISVSDPQQILCSSSGTGDLIGGSSIASPTLGTPGLVSSYAFNFYPEPQGENACGFFNWLEAETETAFDPVPSVANSDEALRPRRILYLET
jgi:hypothetical protein